MSCPGGPTGFLGLVITTQFSTISLHLILILPMFLAFLNLIVLLVYIRETREIFYTSLFLIVIRLFGQTKVYRKPWKSSLGIVEGSAVPDNLHPLESLLEKWAKHRVPYGKVASPRNAIGFMRSCGILSALGLIVWGTRTILWLFGMKIW